ncbi:MAG: flippase-like domain-containing protein [Deltaproteobacteria bacterium]|nr:flippase-like domain-containing protein [Deltaproteobacteria bacterium]
MDASRDLATTADGVARGRLRTGWRLLGSAAVSALLCFVLLRQIDPRELGRWLVRVDPQLFAVYVALSVAGLLARSYRYRMLIGRWVGFAPLVLVTAARNFLVDLLPARVGSLSYVYLLTRRFGVPLEPVLSSFVVTFFYDLFAMTLLLGTAVAVEFGRLEGAAALGAVAAMLGAAALAAFLRLPAAARFAAGRVRRSARGARLAGRLDDLARELDGAGRRGQAAALLAISFVIRLLKFAAYWALLLGVVREHDLTAADLPFWRVFLGIAGAELSATLPIHGIAGIGTYETAWAMGFRGLGMPARVAILSGFATHLLSQLYDYSLGLLALAVALAWSRGGRRVGPGIDSPTARLAADGDQGHADR